FDQGVELRVAGLVVLAACAEAAESNAALGPPLGREVANRCEGIGSAAADARPGPTLVLAVAIPVQGDVLRDVIDLVVLNMDARVFGHAIERSHEFDGG